LIIIVVDTISELIFAVASLIQILRGKEEEEEKVLHSQLVTNNILQVSSSISSSGLIDYCQFFP